MGQREKANYSRSSLTFIDCAACTAKRWENGMLGDIGRNDSQFMSFSNCEGMLVYLERSEAGMA